MGTITITIEQYNKLRRLSDFADWYLDDMEPSNEAYEDDKEDALQAQEVIQEIDARLLHQRTNNAVEDFAQGAE